MAGEVTIACAATDADGTGQGDGSASAEDLRPGTYTCEVFVDP